MANYWKTLEAEQGTLEDGQVLQGLLDEADAIVVGIGAGMSAADGFKYIGSRFTDAFPDFIEKYGLLDMLQASLFDFESVEEYWAFQSRFVVLNYLDQPVGQSYLDLKDMLEGRNYHIITTNADNAFDIADYDSDHVFHIQGEYGLWQCSKHCHQQTYRDDSVIREMVEQQENMKVPSELVPHCPKCGAPFEINKRNEEKGMVEDGDFHAQKDRYEAFLKENEGKKIVFLEIGVGHTTPQFIKHPFQKMTEANDKALFVTMNKKNYRIPKAIRPQTVHLAQDIANTIHKAKNFDAVK
ncbi:MAG: SIR2 family NAD-dependent protein deacylase [Ruoffia tabacinasalis]|uniref:SIR2 family NAD-dependent protein deacylase n=1 Tax=unclassified Ruoffia TaxID=2862149 RepID=UPI000EEBB799|nr:deacetylase SIR2 [Aerococcaceae bacterium]